MPNNLGRPKKITNHIARKIFLMAGYGMTDEQISEVLGMDRITIHRAKQDTTFSNTLAKCKQEADLKVINSLYKKAIGQYVEDKAFCYEGEVIIAQVENHAPSEGACMMWLSNRRGQEWRARQSEDTAIDPNADKRSGTLVQVFQGVRGKELVRIRDGNSQTDVLFGEDFVTESKEKAKSGTDSTRLQ